jgi:hypothetical protein
MKMTDPITSIGGEKGFRIGIESTTEAIETERRAFSDHPGNR